MSQAEEVLASLRSFGEKKRSTWSQTMCPTSMEILGARNPDVRLVMNELYVIYKGKSKDEYLSLAYELLDFEILECQMLAMMLLDRANLAGHLSIEELRKLEGVMDNWVSVDTFGTLIYGVAWLRGAISDEVVFALQDSENVWYRRLALVATVALNLKSRGGQGDAVRTIQMCTRAVEDYHDMVVKALSWALRSLIRWDKEAVSDFMELHREKLKGRVIREVTHKLDFGTKN